MQRSCEHRHEGGTGRLRRPFAGEVTTGTKAGDLLTVTFFLQLYPLDLGHEPAGIVGQEGGYDAEHGVTEAADVQDVRPFRGPVTSETSTRRMGFDGYNE